MSLRKCVPSSLLSIGLALPLCTFNVFAGGFSLYTEGSTSELSVFAAGSAAEAPDASIAWYNPAGLVLIPTTELLFNGIGVFPHTEVSGTAQYLTTDVSPYTQTFNRLDGGRSAFLPTIHAAHPLGEKAAVGLSVLMPFGLSTEYPNQSAVRYAGTLTELITLDVSPDIAGYITDNLSIGLGFDFQWAKVTFNAIAGSPAALQYLESIGGAVVPTTLDSRSENVGTSFGFGFHGGLLWMLNDNKSRIGFNYQSPITHLFQGTSTLSGRLADPSLNNIGDVYELPTLSSNETRLPSVYTLSVFHTVTPKWAMLGSIVYTGWSVFKTTELNDVAGLNADTGLQEPISILTRQNYRNTWRFALGTRYDLNEQLKLRLGGGYDQTPTVNAERDIRLPDLNRWAFAVGLHYQLKPTLSFDAGYVYLWGAGHAPIHKAQIINDTSSVYVDATATNRGQLAGIQAVWHPID